MRAQLRGRALTVQLTRIEHLNIPPAAPVEHRLSIFTLQSIAVRSRFCPSSSPNSIRKIPGIAERLRAATTISR